MTNTPPPADDDATPNDNHAERDTASPETETPVFDDVAAEHPDTADATHENADASSENAETTDTTDTTDTTSDPDAAPELIQPVTPQPTPVVHSASPAGAAYAAGATPATDAARESKPAPLVEPVESPSTEAEAEHRADDVAPETAGYEERIAEPAKPTTTEQAPPAHPQTVYVTAPVAPKKKGNRGFGMLFALLALVVFAILFLAAMALVLTVFFPGDVAGRLTSFVSSSAFIVPLVVFIVAFALLVVIVNRANWWAYVLGSFLVAIAVYFGSIGVVLLTANVFGMTAAAAGASFVQLAASPSIIVATVLAREVTIWFGAAIAARGRKVKVRNVEAMEQYDREVAENRSRYAPA